MRQPVLPLMNVTPLRYMPRQPNFSDTNPVIEGYATGQEIQGRQQQRDIQLMDADTRRYEQMDELARRKRQDADTAAYRSSLEQIVANPDLDEAAVRTGLQQAQVRYGNPDDAASSMIQGFDDQRAREDADKARELEILKMADQNPDMAAEIARREGIDIPPMLLQNAQARYAVLLAHDLGYDDPRQAAEFTNAMLQNGGDQQAAMQTAGAPRPKPAAPRQPSYKLQSVVGPNGQPTLATFESTGGTLTPIEGYSPYNKPGGAGGRPSVFEQKQAAWLAVNPGDEQGALDFASGRRQVPDAQLRAIALKAAEAALKPVVGVADTAAVTQRANEIYAYLVQDSELSEPVGEYGGGYSFGGGFGGDQVAYPQTQQEYDALPPGALYIDPDDGQTYQKP